MGFATRLNYVLSPSTLNLASPGAATVKVTMDSYPPKKYQFPGDGFELRPGTAYTLSVSGKSGNFPDAIFQNFTFVALAPEPPRSVRHGALFCMPLCSVPKLDHVSV